MSLYTPKSLIRQLMMEAENINLNPSDSSMDSQTAVGDFSSPDQIATDLAVQAPANQSPAVGGMPGTSLTMPNITTPQTTISKTVINKDIILAQLAELKSVVTNYEKQFEGDDLTPEDANVYISSLLSTLVFHAEKFNAFMEKSPESDLSSIPPAESSINEPIEPANELSQAEPLPQV